MKNQLSLLMLLAIVGLLCLYSCQSAEEIVQVPIKEYVDSMPGYMQPTIFSGPYVNKDSVPDCRFCYTINESNNTIEYSYQVDDSPEITRMEYSLLPSGDSTVIVAHLWNNHHPKFNSYKQSIEVYQLVGNKWANISKNVMPKEYNQFFSNTAASISDTVILLHDYNNNLEAKLIWKNSTFIFEQPLAENFGVKPDPWDTIITPKMEADFAKRWTKFKSAINNNDTSLLLEMISDTLVYAVIFNGVPDRILKLKKDEIYDQLALLFSVKNNLPNVKIEPLKSYLDAEPYGLPEEHVIFTAKIIDESIDLELMLHFLKVNDKIILKVIENITYGD